MFANIVFYIFFVVLTMAPPSFAQEEMETQSSQASLPTTRPTTKLSPQIRVIEKEEKDFIIPRELIQQFFNQPKVFTETEMEEAAYIVDNAEGSIHATIGDIIYVRDLDNPVKGDNYLLVSPGQVYRDRSGDILAHEVTYLGDAVVVEQPEDDFDFFDDDAPADLTTLKVTKANREIRQGDRVVASEKQKFYEDFRPHAPKILEDAYILGVIDESTEIGQYQVVIINKGLDDNMEIGHLLIVQKAGRTTEDSLDNQKTVRLPKRYAGKLLVFEVFDTISYALVTEAALSIHVFDEVTVP